ncbi:peptidase M4 family protein [Methylobacterium terrae]|uniref:Neutral metalloproteinase n=1 Tax=Methylobacterium terrae TaxID=2202827 RepID=A0A2U8WSE1_9HYPH|nr:M4 family metallopeptidase [Methylobacterium terrae]AWN48330.1 peptidase M4 family protein [Methylobacterium terrae]
MRCTCHIVPADVLRRLAQDASLSQDTQRAFIDTAKVDVEQRRIRVQAVKLTMVAQATAQTVTALAPAPALSLYDCNHTQNLPGTPIANPPASADQTARNVSATTSDVADFYATVFKRNSIDDGGMTLLSSIHYGIKYANAFWNGLQMAYGDGDGLIFTDFSQSNDVIAHELTHGVTQYTLQLNYTNEAGGLNEHLSDCFGSMFRQWKANQTVAQADWLIGKDIVGPQAQAKGLTCLRDMANPAGAHCIGPQITHFSQYKAGMDPHYSSGVPNLAFHTICMAVGGQSWDKVGQVWYRVMTTSGAKPAMRMKTFANRTRSAASQLYPGDTALSQAVDAGWKQVGL